MKKKLLLLVTAISCYWQGMAQVQNDAYTINQNTTSTFNVLANDNLNYAPYQGLGCGIDSSLSNLHVVDYPFPFGSLSSQQGGTLTFNYPANTVTYQPPSGFTGVDKFYYGINNDGTPGNVCDTAVVTVTVQGASASVCDSSSWAWFYDTISGSTNVGTTVYFSAMYTGFHGQTPYGYYTLNGNYLASGLNTYATLPVGTHTVCLHAWYPIYDSATSTYDSCFVQTCSTFNVVGGSSNPCDSISAADFSYSVSGNVVTLNANLPSALSGASIYWGGIYQAPHPSANGVFLSGSNFTQNAVFQYNGSGSQSVSLAIYFNDSTYSCSDTIIKSFVIGGSSSSCDPSSWANFSYSVSGNNVSLVGSYGGFYGQTPYNYYSINGSSSVSGPNNTITLPNGTHNICFYAWTSHYDSTLGYWDTCMVDTCHTITVNGASNPCAGYSLTNISGSGSAGSVVLTATVTGYTPNEVSWFNGGSYLGTGNPFTANLPAGSHTICAYADRVVYDSVSGWDTCYNQFCDSVVVSGGTSGNPCTGATGSMAISNSGTAYTFTASHNMGVAATYEYWVDGVRIGSTIGSNNPTYSQNFSLGSHQICVYIGAGGNFDSIPGIDSCFIVVCDTIYVSGGSNPCAGYSLTNISGSGSAGSVVLTATVTGYSPNDVSWYNGGSYLGSGNPFTANLPAGFHTICAYADRVVYDSVSGWDTCYSQFCDSVVVAGGSSSSCDPSSYVGFNSSVSGSVVTLTGFYGGFHGQTPYAYYEVNGAYAASGLNANLTLSSGTYNICIYAWYPVYDSATSMWDSCFVDTCHTVVVGGGSNPCAGRVLYFNSSVSGTTATLNATHTGYSPNDVIWFNGSTYLGFGSSITVNLGAGTHTICAYADDVFYDSLLSRWDSCSNQYCDSVVVGTASIDEQEALSRFEVYPNPTNGLVNVVIEGNTSVDGQLIVRDILGKTILTQAITIDANVSSRRSFDVSDVNSGSYFISVVNQSNNQIIRTMRFIKN